MRAPIIITMNRMVEIFTAKGSNKFENCLKYDRTIRPMPTGRAVMKNMARQREIISISGASAAMKYLIDIPVIMGRVNIVNMLTTAVYEIDSAVSPPASLLIMFEVTPPGQDANIIIPTASSLWIPKARMIINANSGSITI